MQRPITFVHAADLHLDAPFQGLQAVQPRVAEELIESTYRAFERVVDVCIERSVDFALIAGDVYNSQDKSLRAQIRFQRQMQRLAQAGIPVYVASGNHDPASGWSAGLTLPESVHHFPTDSVGRFVFEREGEAGCVIYGRGYATAKVTENFATGFVRDPSDEVAIGVLHANVGGQPGYEPYAPCSIEDLRSARMDYWALGHIHKPMTLADEPPVRYAGSPQGLNPNESGHHGCLVVQLSSAGASVEFVRTTQVLWASAEIRLGEDDGLEDVLGAVRDECARRREAAEGVPVVLRIDLTGRTATHGDLAARDRFEQLVADARDEQMSERPWVWIDRIRDRTAPTLDVGEIRQGADLAADLVRISDDLLADPESCAAFVEDVTRDLASSVGRVELDPCEVVGRARDACLDELVAGDGS